MKTETEFSKQTLASNNFKRGIILENGVSASKSSDTFNPFINADYFEKFQFDNEKYGTAVDGRHFETLNNKSITLSENSNSRSSQFRDRLIHSEGKGESLDDNFKQSPSIVERKIQLKFKSPRCKIISKSCENLNSPEILPLWKRFSRSLQDRERIENKKAGQNRLDTFLKSIEPLPLSILKMFKNKSDSTEDLKPLDNSNNIGVIDEETDSVLGSWRSSDSLSVTSNIGGTDTQDGLNLVRELVQVALPTSPIGPRVLDTVTLLSESVRSSVTAYNDSLNTPHCSLSETEDARTEGIASSGRNESARRPRSGYSTDSVEGWNNVATSEDESTATFEEIEKSRRSYVNYVTNTSTLRFRTVTDERKLPSTLVQDPGSPDSGFVSTKVLPATTTTRWPETPRTLASSSSSDSVTYVFVDQSLSKNSRNNSEERSSAEANSVIEVARVPATIRDARGDSIVTLDSLEAWKDSANSPRALSVDSLAMERYLKMIDETNPDLEKSADRSSPGNDVRSVRTRGGEGNVRERDDSSRTTSESSESRGSNKYGSDLIKLMSDVVRLLKRNECEKNSANKSSHHECHGRSSRVNRNSVATTTTTTRDEVYGPSTSSSSGEMSSGSDTGRALRRPKRPDKVPTNDHDSGPSRKSEKAYDSFETLDDDDEYRNVMKDSLKKEIRLIRKERDFIYRLLRKEKRKNSSRNNANFKVEDSNSSFPFEATSSGSSRLCSSRRLIIKSDFASRASVNEDIPQFVTPPRQRAANRNASKETKLNKNIDHPKTEKEEDEEEEEKRRDRITPRRKYGTSRFGDGYEGRREERNPKNNRQQQRGSFELPTPDRFKTTKVSRDLGDSGLVDCSSGYWRHSSFHETDRSTVTYDKSVQTTLMTNAREQSTRPKNAGFSSPNSINNRVWSWQKARLSAIKPWRCRDSDLLDDLLGSDAYLELPDEFRRRESLAIPLPSRCLS